MPNEFVARNGIIALNNSIITGSLRVTAGISGSFSGSGANIFDIPASGIVGLNLSQISSGSVSASISPSTGLQVNTNVTATSFTGSLFGTSSQAISSSFSTSSSFAVSASWAPGAGWSLTGNTGTTPTTNFIGTIDDQDLVFRRNNAERLRLTNRDNLPSLEFVGNLRIINPTGASGLLTLAGGAISQANIQIFGSSGGNSNRITFNLGTTNRATLFSSGEWSFELPATPNNAFQLYASGVNTGTLFQVWGVGTTRMLYSYQGNLIIGTDISNQVSSAILQLHSTTKGFLLPRQTTTERNAIASPANSLQIYNTTTNTIDFNRSGSWQQLLHTAGGQTVTGGMTILPNTTDGLRFEFLNWLSAIPLATINGSLVATGSTTNFSIGVTTNGNGTVINGGQLVRHTIAGQQSAAVTSNRNWVFEKNINATENTRAIVAMNSTSQGFLPPRMTTTERNAVTWVAGDAGMIIYNTTTNKHQGWNGTTWNDFY